MKYIWDAQLYDREVHFIVTSFVQWDALEHEVFIKTLETFEPAGRGVTNILVVFKEMNNLQFSGVRELWNERVAKLRRGKRGKVLQQQIIYMQIYTHVLNKGGHGVRSSVDGPLMQTA